MKESGLIQTALFLLWRMLNLNSVFSGMESVAFGNTGLRVSKIGLGLAALGRPGYINLGHGSDLNFNYDENAMQAQASEVLDAAYENGIRYFDAARSYGRAEAFLSEWIRKKKQHDFVAGSKWGYTYTAGWKVNAEKHEVKEHSLPVLSRQWQESKELLGKYLNIYHIHSATLESGVLENSEVLDMLWKLRDSGIIIGLSLSGERQSETLDKALSIISGNEQLFQSVQVTWNILEQSTTNMLLKASGRGVGVIVKEALANGRLTDRNMDFAFADKMNVLKSMAEMYKVGVDALSLAYVLKQPWLNIVLSGASTVAQLLSNLEAGSVKLEKRDLDVLRNMAENSKEYWNKRAGLSWN
jgi:aryl-alcohol dehydrogenase-like predicted oxidoreductase